LPRLTLVEIGITAVPSVLAEAVTKTTVVTESAKSRLEWAVRIREFLSNVSNFLIYLYCEGNRKRKIKNSYFISLDAQKCEQEDADFDVYIKTHLKAAERF